MKYVSYIRVSTQRQGVSGLGLESQKSTVKKYIESNNGNLIAEFQEIEILLGSMNSEIVKYILLMSTLF